MSSDAVGQRGLLFVVSAPSGTGKTTVVERLVRVCPRLERSRSYTSRAMRTGETEGVDYNFISRPAFEAMIARDEFLEWAEVFGKLYGTSRRETEAKLSVGTDVALVIDVQGARQVRRRAVDAVGIFVLPPSREAVERRLRGRSREGEAEIARRMATAGSEVAAVSEYDYVVVNDDLESCVAQMASIVTAERARLRRQAAVIQDILDTFHP
jgi:guanylate kinase